MCVSRACVPCGHACMAAACHTGRPGLATDQPFPSSHLPCVVVVVATPMHSQRVRVVCSACMPVSRVSSGGHGRAVRATVPPDRRLMMNLRSGLSLQAPASSSCCIDVYVMHAKLDAEAACWASCRRWVVLSKLSAARHTQRRASEKSRARATATRPRGF
jgi:hypothetical protein